MLHRNEKKHIINLTKLCYNEQYNTLLLIFIRKRL